MEELNFEQMVVTEGASWNWKCIGAILGCAGSIAGGIFSGGAAWFSVPASAVGVISGCA